MSGCASPLSPRHVRVGGEGTLISLPLSFNFPSPQMAELCISIPIRLGQRTIAGTNWARTPFSGPSIVICGTSTSSSLRFGVAALARVRDFHGLATVATPRLRVDRALAPAASVLRRLTRTAQLGGEQSPCFVCHPPRPVAGGSWRPRQGCRFPPMARLLRWVVSWTYRTT